MGTAGLILLCAGGLPSTGYGGLSILNQPMTVYCQCHKWSERGGEEQRGKLLPFITRKEKKGMVFLAAALHLTSFTDCQAGRER